MGKELESGQAAPSWSSPPVQYNHLGMEDSPVRKKFIKSRSYVKV